MIRAIAIAWLWLSLTGVSAGAEDTASNLNPIHGTWQGPWYRGMNSGVMTLRVASEGPSSASLTNLETFGAAPAELRRTTFDGRTISFQVIGASSLELDAAFSLTADGARLRGFATYEGFKFRVDLDKQN